LPQPEELRACDSNPRHMIKHERMVESLLGLVKIQWQ
jgi:hypothetical protein